MQAIASLRPGTKAAVLGEIKSSRLAITSRRGFKIFHAVVGDASGDIRCKWMNQAYLADILTPHLHVVVFGDVKLDSSWASISSTRSSSWSARIFRACTRAASFRSTKRPGW